jgi:nucleotide-binding universal stress UspA family protein
MLWSMDATTPQPPAEAQGAGAPGPVVLCYDGSNASAAAIRAAAGLLQGRTAEVLSVYVLHAGDLVPGGEDPDERTRTIAEEGVRIAREVGFDATPVTIDSPTIWHGIVRHAERRNAEVVVLGTLGTTALASVLGSVAYGVAHHCHRPVLLVRPDHDGHP